MRRRRAAPCDQQAGTVQFERIRRSSHGRRSERIDCGGGSTVARARTSIASRGPSSQTSSTRARRRARHRPRAPTATRAYPAGVTFHLLIAPARDWYYRSPCRRIGLTPNRCADKSVPGGTVALEARAGAPRAGADRRTGRTRPTSTSPPSGGCRRSTAQVRAVSRRARRPAARRARGARHLAALHASGRGDRRTRSPAATSS